MMDDASLFLTHARTHAFTFGTHNEPVGTGIDKERPDCFSSDMFELAGLAVSAGVWTCPKKEWGERIRHNRAISAAPKVDAFSLLKHWKWARERKGTSGATLTDWGNSVHVCM